MHGAGRLGRGGRAADGTAGQLIPANGGPHPGPARRLQRPRLDDAGPLDVFRSVDRRVILPGDFIRSRIWLATAQCTRSRSRTSTLDTEVQGTRWSRSGFRTTIPRAAAMTRGRRAPTYIIPVTRTSAAAASRETRSRPWTAMSIRLATANASQTHHTTGASDDR